MFRNNPYFCFPRYLLEQVEHKLFGKLDIFGNEALIENDVDASSQPDAEISRMRLIEDIAKANAILLVCALTHSQAIL